MLLLFPLCFKIIFDWLVLYFFCPQFFPFDLFFFHSKHPLSQLSPYRKTKATPFFLGIKNDTVLYAMSISPSKQAAIAAYRNLLKTQREVSTGKSAVSLLLISFLLAIWSRTTYSKHKVIWRLFKVIHSVQFFIFACISKFASFVSCWKGNAFKIYTIQKWSQRRCFGWGMDGLKEDGSFEGETKLYPAA